MKTLVITYGGTELFNSDIAEFSWAETEAEIKVSGRTTARPSLGAALKQAAERRQENNGNEAVNGG